MGSIHYLKPNVRRPVSRSLRARFPGPWIVEECDAGYVVLDALRSPLVTLTVLEDDEVARLHSLMLALAIARMRS